MNTTPTLDQRAAIVESSDFALNRTIIGDCRQTLGTLPEGLFQCCVTSPPAAEALGRRWLGCELTEAYGSLIRQRTAQGGLPWPEDPTKYNPRTIPPRLYDNINCEFATIYNWSDNPTMVQGWIHDAYLRKNTKQPNNSRASFGKNHTGTQWTD